MITKEGINVKEGLNIEGREEVVQQPKQQEALQCSAILQGLRGGEQARTISEEKKRRWACMLGR